MAKVVADNLRRKDKRLMKSWCTSEPDVLAYMAMTESLLSWVVMDPDMNPVGALGADYDDKPSGMGLCWMYSTKDIGKARWSLARGVRGLVDVSRLHWPALRLMPEPWDEKQRRFLKFVGFEERHGELIA